MAVVAVLLTACATRGRTRAPDPPPFGVVRLATYTVDGLSTEKVDSVAPSGIGTSVQLTAAAEIIRRVRPDVLVLTGVDLARSGHGLDKRNPGRVVRRFRERYLEVGPAPIYYTYVFVSLTNAGVLSGLDLDGDGHVATSRELGTPAYGRDSFGFGTYPGEGSMVVLSRFPLDSARVRTFRRFLWRDLPGHHMPEGLHGERAAAFRLSSRSHWDVPVMMDPDTLHLLVSRPASPDGDGPEERGLRRNFDEVGFWARYLDDSEELVDDGGRRGGLEADRRFVVAGNLKAHADDPETRLGDSASIAQLLRHPRVRDPRVHRSLRTVTFGDDLRVDYLLPDPGLPVVGGGVFDPSPSFSIEEAILADDASTHRMVWIDLRLPGG